MRKRGVWTAVALAGAFAGAAAAEDGRVFELSSPSRTPGAARIELETQLDPFAAGAPAAFLGGRLFGENALGLEVTGGLRLRSIGFHSRHLLGDRGQAELVAAVSRRFGVLELALSGALGLATGGGDGSSTDLRASALVHLADGIAAGLVGHAQLELEPDESREAAGGDSNLLAGPAISWSPAPGLGVQAVIGVGQTRFTAAPAVAGAVGAHLNF